MRLLFRARNMTSTNVPFSVERKFCFRVYWPTFYRHGIFNRICGQVERLPFAMLITFLKKNVSEEKSAAGAWG
jgi:hypothetical protein